uniref:Uncharacterized protein n=1 Tax=Anguilla anguilla TaxID=7936 RepID=A0A0E9QLP6_ANGAN
MEVLSSRYSLKMATCEAEGEGLPPTTAPSPPCSQQANGGNYTFKTL